ncbi:MAG: helix-turn-helix domain-containing protein [Magnetococcales bacterium]|nr:helix-turn-helix domain-containing protein [Magnetococcales bacterium]
MTDRPAHIPASFTVWLDDDSWGKRIHESVQEILATTLDAELQQQGSVIDRRVSTAIQEAMRKNGALSALIHHTVKELLINDHEVRDLIRTSVEQALASEHPSSDPATAAHIASSPADHTPPKEAEADEQESGQKERPRRRSEDATPRRRTSDLLHPQEVENFSERIRAARKARGWTRRELATAVGIGRKAIVNIEAGVYPVGPKVRQKLEAILFDRIEPWEAFQR